MNAGSHRRDRSDRSPRRMSQHFIVAIGLAYGTCGQAWSQGGRAREWPIEIRVDGLDRQAAKLLALFEGARAPHPAAAFVGWKRASGSSLSKPLEAAIALFNPLMAPEWRALNGSILWLDPFDQPIPMRFCALIPHDREGVIAAAITTARLSGSGDDPPLALDGRQVDVTRIKTQGRAVATIDGARIVLASARSDLEPTLRATPEPSTHEGLSLLIRLAKFDLAAADSRPWVQAIALGRELGLTRVQSRLGLVHDGLEMSIECDSGLEIPQVAIDPEWYQKLDGSRLLGLVSIALGSDRSLIDRFFSAWDRAEKRSPEWRTAAPLRGRLGLFALAAGVNLETDLWPHLRGITLAATADPDHPGRLSGALAMLHLDGAEAAARLADRDLPRLLERLTNRAQANPGQPGKPQLAGRPFESIRSGSDLCLAWGTGAPVALRGPKIAPAAWAAEIARRRPARLFVIWPGRCCPALATLPAKALEALAADPPLIGLGWNEGRKTHDELAWRALGTRVKLFLDAIPLAAETEPTQAAKATNP